MAVCETVERRARLDGPWSEWLPVVRDSLCANGCREVEADMAASSIEGVVTVSFAPAGPHESTDVAVVVFASLDGGCSVW